MRGEISGPDTMLDLAIRDLMSFQLMMLRRGEDDRARRAFDLVLAAISLADDRGEVWQRAEEHEEAIERVLSQPWDVA
jgi:hypothetical protein